MSGFHPKDLIKEVKIRPGIYNKDELVHPKREHKHQLWMEVAERLTPAEDWESYTTAEREARMDEISTKWKHLKDHFYREIKLQEAGEAHKKRKYIYFDDLEFMRPFVGFRLPSNKSCLPLDNSQDYIDNETDIDMDAFLKSSEQVEEDGEYKMEPEDSQSDVKPKLKNVVLHHKTSSRQNTNANKNLNELKKPNFATNPYFKMRDGDIAFSLSLVPALRKLGDSLKLRAKVDILRVLEGCVDQVETQNSNARFNSADDVEYDMPEDHLDYLDEYEETVNVKHELHDDPLNGSGGNRKTWWT